MIPSACIHGLSQFKRHGLLLPCREEGSTPMSCGYAAKRSPRRCDQSSTSSRSAVFSGGTTLEMMIGEVGLFEDSGERPRADSVPAVGFGRVEGRQRARGVSRVVYARSLHRAYRRRVGQGSASLRHIRATASAGETTGGSLECAWRPSAASSSRSRGVQRRPAQADERHRVAASNSEARRRIAQGGVSVNSQKASDARASHEKGEYLLQVGNGSPSRSGSSSRSRSSNRIVEWSDEQPQALRGRASRRDL